MRKLISIPLLALYVLASTGIYGMGHFCSEELVELAFFNDETTMDCGDSPCCNIPDNNPECCTDIPLVVFYETEKTLTVNHERYLTNPARLPARIFFDLEIPEFNDEKKILEDFHDPDILSSIPIYLRLSSLIFYG